MKNLRLLTHPKEVWSMSYTGAREYLLFVIVSIEPCGHTNKEKYTKEKRYSEENHILRNWLACIAYVHVIINLI